MPIDVVINNDTTTITVTNGISSNWSDVKAAIENSTTPVVTMKLNSYTNNNPAELVIPATINTFNLSSSSTIYPYFISIQAASRNKGITVSLENITLNNANNWFPMIDIAKNNHNNILILNGTNKFYTFDVNSNLSAVHVASGNKLTVFLGDNSDTEIINLNPGASIGGSDGETAGTIIIDDSGTLTLSRGVEHNTAAAVGGGHGGGGGFIYIKEAPTLIFEADPPGPNSIDIGNGLDYTGDDSFVFIGSEKAFTFVKPPTLYELSLKYNVYCRFGQPFLEPILLNDTNGNTYGIEFSPSINGNIRISIEKPGTYYFTSTDFEKSLKSSTFDLNNYTGDPLYFDCTRGCSAVCRGINFYEI